MVNLEILEPEDSVTESHVRMSSVLTCLDAAQQSEVICLCLVLLMQFSQASAVRSYTKFVMGVSSTFNSS